MSKVQHIASLHEKTVQKVARGEVVPTKQRRHTTTPRWGLSVHPLVMEAVRRVRRPGTTIRIINEGTVLIINKEK